MALHAAPAECNAVLVFSLCASASKLQNAADHLAYAVVVVVLCDQIALRFDIRLCIAHRHGKPHVV